MKTALQNELLRIADVLRALSEVSDTLPDEGPAPFMVSTFGKGEITFQRHAIEVVNAFGTSGWARVSDDISTRYVKHLPNGVTIVIDNAEPREAPKAEPIDPARFASLS